MDKRFQQANKEAKISLLLTVCYLVIWIIAAYSLGNEAGFLGLPRWFEASCLFLPIAFIIVCWLVVKLKFVDVPLDSPDNNQ